MPSQNYNEGKSQPSLVLKDMPNAFNEWLKVRHKGIEKGYDRMNWAESIGTDDAQRFLDENVDSIFRHLLSYMSGETHDPESGCHHLAHVMCRAGFAIEYDNRQTDNERLSDILMGESTADITTMKVDSIKCPNLWKDDMKVESHNITTMRTGNPDWTTEK